MNGARYTDGTVVYDAATKKVGVVVACYWSVYYLRPQGGGLEWTAKHGDLDSRNLAVLGPAVAALNANSSRGIP
ncbi:hypothetical protein ACH41E_01625 [Streptomyces sp. NPDC020412]|uniref:hypothetical protein n=1 Tax=Streptomyces sp. NPDC020412 TaxID=3365073 RepID=UPI0037B3C322